MTAGEDADREDREWDVSLEDLEDESEGSVAGALAPAGEIEAGDIDPEHALFVALGVVSACLVVLTFVLAAI